MSQLQQLSLRQPQIREKHADRLEDYLQRYEASLLSELFGRNGRENSIQTATPPGYRYEREDAIPSLPVDASGPVMQVAAHPGDGPDFFYATYLKMATNAKYCNDYHEVLLTDGEGGVDGWHPERTRQVRVAEAYAGARIVGSRLHFLGYPDGSLPSLAERKRTQLITTLAALIGDIQPSLLVVHPPKNDHPDHAYSFLLTLAALELNAHAGRRLPTLLIHDVEFGLQQESLWTPHAIDVPTHIYPMHVSGFIVDISSTHQTAQRALYKHKTQMYDPISGQPKAYADLIETLAQVRGLQFMARGTTQIPQGQGFSHIVIPGVTSEQNALLFRVPAGSVYKRVNSFASPFEFSADALHHLGMKREKW
jgi:LmbE family N-acetylglucosaminyl deacetylase